MKKIMISEKNVIYQSEEILKWLTHHFGDGLPYEYSVYPEQKKLKKFCMHACRWCYIDKGGIFYFYFKDISSAVLFKLAWGGE